MTHDTTELRDVPPSEALELYLEEKQRECSINTVKSHASRLGKFIDWFQSETEYDYLNELDGYDLKLYQSHRFDDTHSKITIKTQLHTLRVFLRFSASIEAVPRSLGQKIQIPDADSQRGNEIPHERATQILEYLNKYEYATQTHVCCHLLWYSAVRVGTVHSIDVQDVDLDSGQIKIEHRPDEGTRLKNGEEGERVVAIRPETVRLIQDYIDTHRHNVVDNHGREPLITTTYGRATRKTIRNWSYSATRPCIIINECPHNRELDQCDAAQNVNKAHGCPDSESTHAWRRGSISWHLHEGTSKTTVGDRADVSVDVLDKHYNMLTDEEQAEARREKLPDRL